MKKMVFLIPMVFIFFLNNIAVAEDVTKEDQQRIYETYHQAHAYLSKSYGMYDFSPPLKEECMNDSEEFNAFFDKINSKEQEFIKNAMNFITELMTIDTSVGRYGILKSWGITALTYFASFITTSWGSDSALFCHAASLVCTTSSQIYFSNQHDIKKQHLCKHLKNKLDFSVLQTESTPPPILTKVLEAIGEILIFSQNEGFVNEGIKEGFSYRLIEKYGNKDNK